MDKDMKFRNELKYYIGYNEYIAITNRLQLFMERDLNTLEDGSYHVRSLYFDDIYDSALYEKNAGIYHRRKYRVRIYNRSSRVINLEKKSKFDNYISKESALISKPEFYKILNNDIGFMLSSDNKLCREFYIQCKNNLLRPKIIVDYDREVFVKKDTDLRITFDMNMCAVTNSFDIFDDKDRLIPISLFKEPRVVMEIKYSSYLPEYIKSLLRISSIEHAAISKYVLSRLLKIEKGGGHNG